MSDLRSLPSVDQTLSSDTAQGWVDEFGRPLTVAAIRQVLNEVRSNYVNGDPVPDIGTIHTLIGRTLQAWTAPSLAKVINATGVILHTNLGRAPLSSAAIRAVQDIAGGYSNLEYDLARGRRGSRLVHAEKTLQQLTGAEAAVVVNNNASAVMLALSALARRRGVVISRSQLVEIGGGFRVPEVMKQSGARLIEVGTTNIVHLRDYEVALEDKPAAFLRAHRSNFQIIGFTSEPDLVDIVTVAHLAGIPFIDDLGSGALLDTANFGLAHEPTVQESLNAGVDLVCFSGDKLLGGPQAGIILGRRDLVDKIKKHPLARAIRADKLCLAALSATLLHYLQDEAEQEIPIWRMIAIPTRELEVRIQGWRNFLGHGQVINGESTVGGGSLPGETLPTCLLALSPRSLKRFLVRLRTGDTPVVGRVFEDQVVFDARTVLPSQDNELLRAIQQAFI
jgi:L-seryl-tRNA(Ser) seleniumtransferase